MTSGKPKLITQSQSILRIVDERRCRDFQPDFAACILEPQPVFGDFNGTQRRANHLDFVLFENATLRKFNGKIQSGLPSHGGQKRVGFFPRKNFFQVFLGEWLDVSSMSQLRIGHDRRRIRINQNDFVALRAQRFAGLSAGIIKFAGLPDDDGARANDQNFLDVSAFWHWLLEYRRLPQSKSKRRESFLADGYRRRSSQQKLTLFERVLELRALLLSFLDGFIPHQQFVFAAANGRDKQIIAWRDLLELKNSIASRKRFRHGRH